MVFEVKKYVIGVDCGGTKTVAALADLDGKILRIRKAGPAHLRNAGIEKAVENAAKSIKRVLKNEKNTKILATFIGFPAFEERYRQKRLDIKKEFLKHKELKNIFSGKIIIDSDQIVAFRAGTDEKEGILLIAGTGCVVRGWKKEKSVHVSGWGWLADEGSAFWVGHHFFQEILKEADGRAPKSSFKRSVFSLLKIKSVEKLIELVYSKNPTEIIPLFSIFCDKAAKNGDREARNILIEGGRELFLAANSAIKQLKFQREKFPVVLVGGMFKSKIIFDTVKKEIKKIAPKAEIIMPKGEPVIGAVKLAIESVK